MSARITAGDLDLSELQTIAGTDEAAKNCETTLRYVPKNFLTDISDTSCPGLVA